MASVYKRGGKWYVRYLDAGGRWRSRKSVVRTKRDAKRMAHDLETKEERQRLGLELAPLAQDFGTLGDLLRWWLDTYSMPAPSHKRNGYTIKKHFLDDPMAELHLPEVTSGAIESFLQKKTATLAPQTLNHLRRYLLTAFACARRAGRYVGTNPAKEVARRKVPKRKPDFLRMDEVPRVLNALTTRWRPLFATAIYSGLRKGELLGLRKADVDLANRLIFVSRSYDRQTTKGKHEEAVPIAAELVPILQFAIEKSPSELVFPRQDGTMMREDTDLENVLRRALARAGIVLGYTHVCRRKGCTHRVSAPDAGERRCPTHRMLLWPKARVRPIRFHDLRHTTASLLLMAGANPAAVQRILRHADPRITTEVYGHLLPGYLRTEIDRLSFGLMPPDSDPQGQIETVAGLAAIGAVLVTPLLQGPGEATPTTIGGSVPANEVSELDVWARRDSNSLPPASEAGTLSK
jgi:integrase